ncbi:unnamed protein product [Macrosiphum euphorbiae]|uniref:Reverse transcriptase domain-containing protein n=1 Tax=Macrosiphum euphorbiae TaxID=13131 RepID=A0AAV0WRR8_9HEMI|nr:unnamed protein product [Macrosiphum euphorbiae]
MFANDSTIYCKGRNINTSKTIMQNAINEISKLEKSTGFKFGPAKSKSILFNQGIRLSIGAFKTSPIPSIPCEANTPPLEIRRNMLIHKFALKRLADKDNAISPYLFNTLPPSLHLRKNQPISTRIKKRLDTTNTTMPKLLSPDPYICPPWKMNLNINTSMIQEIQNIEPSEIPKHFNDIILKNFCDHKII